MNTLPSDSLEWLIGSGYANRNQLGYTKIIKAPKADDLAQFVYAIKTLGAWSIGNARRVEVSCGCEPYELVFKLSKI